jgi:hypothetical protein
MSYTEEKHTHKHTKLLSSYLKRSRIFGTFFDTFFFGEEAYSAVSSHPYGQKHH